MKNLLSYSKTLLTVLLFVLGSLSLWAQTNVELDAKTGDLSSINGKKVNITIKNRTYQANNWVVVCYPFDVTKTMLDDAFPQGYAVEEYSSMSTDGKFTFTVLDLTSKSISAGTPFLLKSKEAVSSVTFNNVTINTTLHNVTKTNGSYSGTLVGTYSKPAMWQFNSGQSLAGGLFISASETLTGPYNSPLNDDTDILRITNGYFSFSTGVSTTLSIESVNTDNPGGTGGTITPPSAATLAEKIANHEQLTNLATIYMTIDDQPEDVALNDWLYKDRKNNIAPYRKTTIKVVDGGTDGTGRTLENFTEEGLEIKVRGNSTAEYDKKPYRLRFYKDVKDDAGNVTASYKHDMLGYGYAKRNWTLLANHKDATLMQNAITYYIGKAVGMPFCPGYKFVDLVINGEYRGNYMLSDHCELGKNRININEDTGWFVESTRNDMVEEPYFNDAGLYVLIKNPESKDENVTAEIKKMIRKYFVNNNNTLFGINTSACDDETFRDPFVGWRSVFDEESLVNFYVGLNLTGDSDGMMQVKMYREPNGKMMFGPLWDKDLAFGVQDNGTTLAEGNDLTFGAPTFNNYIKKIMKTDPVFVKKVHDKLHEVVDNDYVDKIIAEIDKIEPTLLASKALEYENCEDERAVSVSDYPEAVERLRQYIRDHTKWFVDFMDERYENNGGDNITIPVVGEMPNTNEMKLSEWKYFPINSALFKNNATSANITVTGASAVKFYNTDAVVGNSIQDTYLVPNGDFGSKDANKAGVTLTIDGQLLNNARSGNLYVYVGGGSDIKLTVENIVPATPTTPATRAQLTNLPTIYLDATVGNDWSGATLEVFDADNKLGQGATWTKTTADVSVQYQGSGDKNKDSYRLKFEAKTQLLSSGKFKQWVLLANDDDPTMMRNALAKEMGDALGLPFTPGYQFVDLYVNNTYMGTYQVTDRIKVESGRALVTGGNKDDDWHVRLNDQGEYDEDKPTYYIAGTTSMPYIIPKNPDPKDDETTWNNTLKYAMTTYFNNVFATTDGKYTAFAENVDKQQLIQWYIAQEMLGVYKGFSSIEAYRSVAAADQNLHIGILWDSEKAFGNTGEAPAISMADIETAGSYDGLMTNYAAYDVMKNIFSQLWQERWFANGVNNLWKEKHEAMLTAMTTKATALKTELEGSWAQNATKWSITGEQATSIDAMTAWLTQRDAYLTKKFAALAAAVPCETHIYENNNYIEQTNGTFLLGCDICGTVKEGSETYYKFLVYPESAESTDVYATSWQPSVDKPNSIAVVEAKQNIVEQIEGWNIVCGKKNAAGDLTCKDFRLTDGHPYYSNNKFVATTATYSRNISNAWGTLVLPYKMQNAETEYANFYHLGEVKTTDGDASTLVFTSVNPDVDGDCSAYVPVVFKATDKALQEGQIIVNGENITVKKSSTQTDISKQTVADWTLIGTIEQKIIEDVNTELAPNENLYYISKNQFWHATGKYTNNPFRAYFISTSSAGAKSFSISLAEDELPTKIESIKGKPLAVFVDNGSITITSSEKTDVRIYNASGAMVTNTSVGADEYKTINLTAGLYIVNGTKIIVK